MRGSGSSSRPNANNHSNQLNPNNTAYWSSRGSTKPAPAPGAQLQGTPPDAGKDTSGGQQKAKP